VDIGLGILMELKENEQAENPAQHRDTVQTLFKIIANLISKALDPTVRRFNKSNKAIQAKILAFPSAINFLRMVGFDFERSPDAVELFDYRREVLDDALYALELHIKNQGGQVKSEAAFDPFKSSIARTDG